MYVPPAFRDDDLGVLHAAMHASGLATLVTATAEGLLATPLPLILAADEGPQGTLYGHLARANPQATLPPIGEAMVLFGGPDAYISPSWYPSKREHGRVVPDLELRGHPRLRRGRVLRRPGAAARARQRADRTITRARAPSLGPSTTLRKLSCAASSAASSVCGSRSAASTARPSSARIAAPRTAPASCRRFEPTRTPLRAPSQTASRFEVALDATAGTLPVSASFHPPFAPRNLDEAPRRPDRRLRPRRRSAARPLLALHGLGAPRRLPGGSASRSPSRSRWARPRSPRPPSSAG